MVSSTLASFERKRLLLAAAKRTCIRLCGKFTAAQSGRRHAACPAQAKPSEAILTRAEALPPFSTGKLRAIAGITATCILTDSEGIRTKGLFCIPLRRAAGRPSGGSPPQASALRIAWMLPSRATSESNFSMRLVAAQASLGTQEPLRVTGHDQHPHPG
jgi:hypothetical protein